MKTRFIGLITGNYKLIVVAVVVVLGHSIVNARRRVVSAFSGDRKITDCIGFSVIFGRFSVFPVCEIPTSVSVSVF